MLSTKIYVPKETKSVILKVSNMITRKNKVKVVVKIFHMIVNESLIAKLVIQIKSWIMTNVNVSARSIVCAKKINIGTLVRVFVRIVSI